MKIKKLLSTIISFIILISPISSAIRPKNIVFTGNAPESFVDDYLEKGSHIPTFGFKSVIQLIAYLKYDIKHNININDIKDCYYNYFQSHLYGELLKNQKSKDQIQNIFTFFFSYVVVGIISGELKSKTIDFKTLKHLFTYLRNEDMHFLFYAYLVADSHPYLAQAKIYIDHAIKDLAQKGKEKPINNNSEDFIHKTFRKNSKDKALISLLKDVYDEYLTSFNSFFEKNQDNLTLTQKGVMEIISMIITHYKKTGTPSSAIDLYEKYFKEAYPKANPR